MFSKITVKLTSPFLGSSKPNDDGVREIVRIDGNPKLFIQRFNQLCIKYAEELSIGDFDIESIKITSYLESKDETSKESRTFKNKFGMSVTEEFEAFPAGAFLSFGCYIDEKRIKLEHALKIIECIGKYDGFTQFGYKWNYGRFDVITVEKIKVQA